MIIEKKELHPRSLHRGAYDFKALVKDCPELGQFIGKSSYGKEALDFSNPRAVKMLNKAILKSYYNISWDIPKHYLCPPIPGRADYVHYVADLLGDRPKNETIHVLDIGIGANCIYPLIGHRVYGWHFIGTEIDPVAIAHANGTIKQNGLSEVIEIRLQKSPTNIFEGVINSASRFDISMCNPPFHASAEEAKEATERKWKNLGIKTTNLNFGGQYNELWCPGGEVAFIKQMIKESVHVNCKQFTTLVSKASSLPSIYAALKRVNAVDVKTINLGQGQKRSRLVAWTF